MSRPTRLVLARGPFRPAWHGRKNRLCILACLVVALLGLAAPGARARGAERITIGSKLDTESVTLAEMAKLLARLAGADVAFRPRLGGTRIAWEALLSGSVDLYPEYTGTLYREILAGAGLRADDDLRAELARRGLGMTGPLGFNNTYALGVPEASARRLGLRTLSDLRGHPELRLGFSNEFMTREDGWPGLRAHYRLPQTRVSGLSHTLAYRAMGAGTLDVTDLYSTDGEIRLYGLRVLEDDLHYFPEYKPVFLYRLDLARRAPAVIAALRRLEGKIAEADMVRMNQRTGIEQQPNEQVAAEFLRATVAPPAAGDDPGGAGELTAAAAGGDAWPRSWRRDVLRWTLAHLKLVSLSLAAAIVVGLPLGVAAAKVPALGQPILAAVAVLYTIPSLALLAFLIGLLGMIGDVPAMLALFLYSLLPIVRNTHAGLVAIPPPLRESAEALGLPPLTRLRTVELPLAAGPILAGIKTAAVVNVGTATLGALIGAGGYGEPIVNGLISSHNNGLVLTGAACAAAMALLVQGLFEWVERRVIPAGLRAGRSTSA